MSDFVSSFWDYYVIVLVAASLGYCVWILFANMTYKKGPQALHGHTWDEDLQEYNNPLPRWWFYMFVLTILFGVAYLVLFPGLGSRPGILGWSSVGQYKAEVASADERIAPIFDKFVKQDLLAVAADPEAQAIGQRLFLTYCAQCHGSDARGSKGFPNLADKDWLHGSDPATVQTTIMNGRIGIMPPLGQIIGGDSTKDVANYVRAMAGLGHDSLRAQRGRAVFAANCAACHGAQGAGNPALGAPNLSDKTWLYGSSEATIIETIAKGRQNQMPAFNEIIGEAKVHLLAAYVLGLSK